MNLPLAALARTSRGSSTEGAKLQSPRNKLRIKPEVAGDNQSSKGDTATRRQSSRTISTPSTKSTAKSEKVDGGQEAPAPQAAKVDETGKPLSGAAHGKPLNPSRKTEQGGSAAEKAAQAPEDDDSSDDDGDGFRIVVGRDREATQTPAMPVKRFLRGMGSALMGRGLSRVGIGLCLSEREAHWLHPILNG